MMKGKSKMKDLNKDRDDQLLIPEDRELSTLLESWIAPDVPRSLDGLGCSGGSRSTNKR